MLTQRQIDDILNASREADEGPTQLARRIEAAAVAAERERLAAAPIDYKAAIHHCWTTLGHAQGTRGCIAFARGAEWSLAQVKAELAASRTAENPAGPQPMTPEPRRRVTPEPAPHKRPPRMAGE